MQGPCLYRHESRRYIAAPDGSVAWLEAYPMEEFDFMGFARTIAVTVMGRRTYDESFARGGPNPGGGRPW